MMGGVLPGASGSQAGFFKSIRQGLNGGLGRLDLTRAGLVAGHFGGQETSSERADFG